MHVISFVTQKGGSGKSTTAASVAVAALEQGRRVFLLELDRQGTLSDWNESRKAETGPEFERIDATALDKAISTLKDADYELVVIDTPGIDSPAANAAMRVARKAVRLCPDSVPSPFAPRGRDQGRAIGAWIDRRAANREPDGSPGRDSGGHGSDRIQRGRCRRR
jgi:cellulose biosynthesis protein BcsQ